MKTINAAYQKRPNPDEPVHLQPNSPLLGAFPELFSAVTLSDYALHKTKSSTRLWSMQH